MKKIILALMLVTFANTAIAKEYIEQDYNKKHGYHIFTVDTKKMGKNIRPYMVEDGFKTARDLKNENEALDLVVNGGYFDFNNKKSVSYITIDGNCVASPFDNMEMIEKLNQEKRAENVLNRAELRIYKNQYTKRLKFDIVNHFERVPFGYNILHSIGAGPMIVPDLNLEEEGFVRYGENNEPIFQSASVLKKRARTLVGLKKNKLYVIIYSQYNPVTLSETIDDLERYNFDKLMSFDGGPSTSLNYKDFEINSNGKEPNQRAVKSFLVIEKRY